MTIVQVTRAISNAVNLAIENSQVEPLQDGKILLGREFADDRRSPNSIVFVPVRTAFGPSLSTATSDTVALAPGGGFQRRLLQRTVASRRITFEVHIWGAAKPGDPFNDWDVAEGLAELVVLVVYKMVGQGNLTWGEGVWVDQQVDSEHREAEGHYLVFPMTLEGSVVDTSVNPMPPGTALNPTLNLNVKIG
jgi:hypothetical protein